MSESSQSVHERHAVYAGILDSLLGAAFATAPFGVVCTLLRVGGMQDADWDPLGESRAAFEDYDWILERVVAERGLATARRVGLLMYCQAVEMDAPHEILANLLRCVAKSRYSPDPFLHLARKSKKGKLNVPSATKKFQYIQQLADTANKGELKDAINGFFDERVRNAYSHSDYVLTEKYFRFADGGVWQQIEVTVLDRLIAEALAFYDAFLQLYKQWLHAIGSGKKFHKTPHHRVLELLSSDDVGLYGFNIHFSNGSRSTFTRRKSGSEAVNLFLGDHGVTLMMGSLDELEPTWKINGKQVEDWDALP